MNIYRLIPHCGIFQSDDMLILLAPFSATQQMEAKVKLGIRWHVIKSYNLQALIVLGTVICSV